MKKLLEVFVMMGESKDGHQYQTELVCESGKEKEAFASHIVNKGWDHYGYELLSFEKPKTTHIDLELES